MSEKDMRVYELGYLLVPATPETEVPSKVDVIKSVITGLGGTVSSSGAPEFIDLAYQMEKNIASKKMKWNQGYFGWMKFESSPESMDALKKSLDANTDVIRFLIVKTDVGNNVVFKKPKIEAVRASLEEEDMHDEEESVDDMQEDHERLPDLEAEVTEAGEEKEGEE